MNSVGEQIDTFIEESVQDEFDDWCSEALLKRIDGEPKAEIHYVRLPTILIAPNKNRKHGVD